MRKNIRKLVLLDKLLNQVDANTSTTMEIQLKSVITCPECGHKKEEEMPTEACQFFYQCAHCKVLLKPKEGDCCVYCSYGSVPCPPIQVRKDCCH